MSEPQYRPVEGFSKYRIGDDGSVWTYRMNREGIYRWKLLKPATLKGGHRRVTLSQDGKKREALVHRLVLEAFVGPCPPGMECCHWDDNPNNNNLSNLRWDTSVANHKDRARNGKMQRGSRHCRAKFTEELVTRIRKQYATGLTSHRELARAYGVGDAAITSILNRRTWKHIP